MSNKNELLGSLRRGARVIASKSIRIFLLGGVSGTWIIFVCTWIKTALEMNGQRIKLIEELTLTISTSFLVTCSLWGCIWPDSCSRWTITPTPKSHVSTGMEGYPVPICHLHRWHVAPLVAVIAMFATSSFLRLNGHEIDGADAVSGHRHLGHEISFQSEKCVDLEEKGARHRTSTEPERQKSTVGPYFPRNVVDIWFPLPKIYLKKKKPKILIFCQLSWSWKGQPVRAPSGEPDHRLSISRWLPPWKSFFCFGGPPPGVESERRSSRFSY